jgi:hypothetical protein
MTANKLNNMLASRPFKEDVVDSGYHHGDGVAHSLQHRKNKIHHKMKSHAVCT